MNTLTSLMTLRICELHWLLVALYATCGAGQAVWANDTCKYIDTVTVHEPPEYLPESVDVPETLRITLRVTHSTTCDGGCVPANPQVKVSLLDCNGVVLRTKTRYFSPPCPPATGDDIVSYEFGLNDDGIPMSFRIQEREGCSGGLPCNDGSSWQPPEQPILLPELSFQCPAEGADLSAFVNELHTYGCGQVTPIADSVLSLFKRKRNGSYTLYTLPGDDELEANFGEIVNGSFVAPQDGFLVVKIVGANDIVDMYGSNSPNDPAWHLPSQPPDGRSGVKVDPTKCLDLSSGQTYQLNIRAGKGKPPPSVKVYFNWFWKDEGNCCLVQESRLWNIGVREMELDYVMRVRPERASVPRNGGVETELRIPACGDKQGEAGMLTPWIVMWPTLEYVVIREGHAKGWKIVGDTLIAPRHLREIYNFNE